MQKSLLGVGFLCATLAYAQETNVPVRFKNNLNIGLTLTEGNSETTHANVSWTLTDETEKGRLLRMGAEGNYAWTTVASNKETTVENARLFASIRGMISEKIGCGASSSYF